MLLNKNKIIENAQGFVAQGKLEKAISEWKRLLSETPQDGNIYNAIADLYLRMGDREGTIDACLNAARIYKEAGFELKGVAILKKILKIDPERIDIYERLADINVERGLTGSAVEAYQQTAKLYLQRSNLKGAIGVYRKLASFSPEDPEIPLAIARLYRKQEQNREAILAYEQAEVIYESKKMLSEARQVVDEIVKIDPSYLKHLATKEGSVAALDKGVESKGVAPPAQGQGTQAPIVMESEAKEGYNDLGPRQLGGREHEVYKEIEPYKMASHQMEEGEPLPLPSWSPPPLAFPEQGAITSRNVVPQAPSQVAPMASLPPILPPAPFMLPLPPMPMPMEQGKAPTQTERNLLAQKESLSISEVIFRAHLAEVDVYLRYGLNQNAIEKLLVAKELVPMREEPYLKLRDIYLKDGQHEKAAQISVALATLYEQKNELGKRDLLLRDMRQKETQENSQGRKDPSLPMGLGRGGGVVKQVTGVMPSPFSQQQGSFLPDDLMVQPEEFIEVDHPLAQGMRSETQRVGEVRVDEGYIDLASVMADDLVPLNEVSFVAPQSGKEYQEKGQWPAQKMVADPAGAGVVNETRRQEYVETCYHIGIAHKETGNYEKAIRELEQALSVSGGGRFHEVLLLLAACYSESGYISQSIEVLQGGINDPRCGAESRLFIQYELASYFEQLGDREKSFSLYKEVYRIDPHFKDVFGKVKEIPYRKAADIGRVNERLTAQDDAGGGIEDTEKHGLYLKGRPKDKRRISYI